MTRLRTFALMSIAALTVSACSMEGVDADSTEGIIQITHTTNGSVYWQ